MTQKADIPSLERITFFTGLRLTAADLTEVQRARRELGWLHNRSLHRWGIAAGFAVTGERGATAVTVEPGYALDCLGRELILTEPRTVPVPAVAGAAGGGPAIYFLTASYLADEDQAVAERRPGVCLPGGTVRLSEGPRLSWRDESQLREGLDVVLAQAWVEHCRLARPLSLAARRSARPGEQPYIAAGQTEKGATAWEAWRVDDQIVGALVRVGTEEARFRTTPRYQAHAVGPRAAELPFGFQTLIAFPSLAEATPDGFTFRLLLPNLGGPEVNPWLPGEPELGPQVLAGVETYVVWMGVEG